MTFTSWKALAAVAGLAVTTAGCGDVVRQGRAPVFLVVDSLLGSRGASSQSPYQGTLLSDVITYVTSPPPCAPASPCPTVFNDYGRATLSIVAKDNSAVSPSNSVTINRYRVNYRRSDGRNTPGVDVPYGFDGSVTGTISGPLTLDFELVRHVAKEEAPLAALTSSPTIISTIADITFYGRDLVGNEINVTGSISIDFGNFGDR